MLDINCIHITFLFLSRTSRGRAPPDEHRRQAEGRWGPGPRLSQGNKKQSRKQSTKVSSSLIIARHWHEFPFSTFSTTFADSERDRALPSTATRPNDVVAAADLRQHNNLPKCKWKEKKGFVVTATKNPPNHPRCWWPYNVMCVKMKKVIDISTDKWIWGGWRKCLRWRRQNRSL
jgi:hypothetical protein